MKDSLFLGYVYVFFIKKTKSITNIIMPRDIKIHPFDNNPEFWKGLQLTPLIMTVVALLRQGGYIT